MRLSPKIQGLFKTVRTLATQKQSLGKEAEKV